MKKIIQFTCIIILCSISFSQVESQYRGIDGEGKYLNEKLIKKWPQDGPKLLKSIHNLGVGYSSPAVTKDRIYVTGLVDTTGYLSAFNLSGKLIWKKPYGPEYDAQFPGTRGTPTVVGNKIYLISGLGRIVCFDTTGKLIWKLEMQEKFAAPLDQFGFAESPTLYKDYLFCTPGSKEVSIAVLNRHTGELVKQIRGIGETSAFCSPTIKSHNGKDILFTIMSNSLIGIDVRTLKIILNYPFTKVHSSHSNTPIYSNGYLYLTSGYEAGSLVLKLSYDGTKAIRVWKNSELDNEMGGSVLLGDYIFGCNMKKRGWHCINFLTGQIMYSERKVGYMGVIIYADDLLYLYSTRGIVSLVKPDINKFDVISTFRIREGNWEHFSHPVINSGRLYIRHGNVLNIYDIAR